MRTLPELGTWHSFTDAELERMGVEYKTMHDFMTCVLVSTLQEHGFYPPQERIDEH